MLYLNNSTFRWIPAQPNNCVRSAVTGNGSPLSAAQVLPTFAGAVLGIPGGIGLYMTVVPDEAPIPPLWWLLAVVAGTVLVVAVLTTIPARLGARRPVAPILQAELA